MVYNDYALINYALPFLGLIITLMAQIYVNNTYNKYKYQSLRKRTTGAEIAREILDKNGLKNIKVVEIKGNLTDHYDPKKKVLRLSDSVYGSTSVAAVGVAAHECGHALQHKEGYGPLKLRSMLVPAANIGSKLGLPLVILGLALGFGFELPGGGYFSLAQIGVWVFSLAVLFQVITLPVEFNASGRALRLLESYGILGADEVDDCKHVLGAAALTYVAAAASSILQLLRLMMLSNRRRRD